jgi:hypothetical protein
MPNADTELEMVHRGSGEFSIHSEPKVGSASNSNLNVLPSAAAAANGIDDEFPAHEFSLPPVDSGKDAWLFLAACFVMEALIWGE